MNQKDIDKIKEKYPEGTVIRLFSMKDEQSVPPQTLGTVDHVDDIGTIHMRWENGSGLGLIEGEDQFEILEKQLPYQIQEHEEVLLKAKLNRLKEKLFMNEISIEKEIILSDTDYQYFKEHLNEDYNFIRESRNLLSKIQDSIPCLLVRGETSEDRLIIQTDGVNHVEYYTHIPQIQNHIISLKNEKMQPFTEAVFFCKDTEMKPKKCIIEKIIQLKDSDFEYFSKHLLEKYSFIASNTDYMFDEEDCRHVLLVTGDHQPHGILVQSAGYDYARYTAWMPHACFFIEQYHLQDLIEKHHLLHMRENGIRVLVVEPMKKPYEQVIENKLEEMQKLVDGRIEVISISDTADIICNEEGKLLGLEPNRRLKNDVIVGTFLIVGNDSSEDFCSLSEQDIQKYKERFSSLEEIRQEEVPVPYFKFIGLE